MLSEVRKKMVDFGTILAVIGIPVLRSVGGWATKATKDGKITKFEVKLLGKTVLRTLVIAVMIFFGADGVGIDVTVVGSAASAVIFDMIISAFKENNNITKR